MMIIYAISVVPLQGLFTKLICMPGVNSLIPTLHLLTKFIWPLTSIHLNKLKGHIMYVCGELGNNARGEYCNPTTRKQYDIMREQLLKRTLPPPIYIYTLRYCGEDKIPWSMVGIPVCMFTCHNIHKSRDASWMMIGLLLVIRHSTSNPNTWFCSSCWMLCV